MCLLRQVFLLIFFPCNRWVTKHSIHLICSSPSVDSIVLKTPGVVRKPEKKCGVKLVFENHSEKSISYCFQLAHLEKSQTAVVRAQLAPLCTGCNSNREAGDSLAAFLSRWQIFLFPSAAAAAAAARRWLGVGGGGR